MTQKTLTALAVAGALLPAPRAFSAPPELSARADRKITGQYYLPHSASAYQRAAREHAKALNYYGQNYPTVPKEITREHLAEIRRNVAASQKEVAKLKPEAAKDKKLQQSLVAIEQRLARCLDACTLLANESDDTDTSDGAAVCDCCEKIERELAAAEAENDKIKKHLGVDKTVAPKKDGKPKK